MIIIDISTILARQDPHLASPQDDFLLFEIPSIFFIDQDEIQKV
jgi:hypothetical protein